MENTQSTAKATITVAIALAVSTYFAETDAKNEVYSTADGFIFENLVFAKNHAITLEDKNVTPHTKANNLEVVDEEEVTGDDNVYQLKDSDKELFESGLVKDNYNKLKALAKNLKLDTADQKAETLIVALEEYKATNLTI